MSTHAEHNLAFFRLAFELLPKGSAVIRGLRNTGPGRRFFAPRNVGAKEARRRRLQLPLLATLGLRRVQVLASVEDDWMAIPIYRMYNIVLAM